MTSVCMAATVAGASASGTLMIQRGSAGADRYDPVKIQVIHNTFNVTSADGRGTMIITRAACYQKDVMVCLPTGITLIQDGTVHALDLRKGTLYVNMSGSTQTLSHSTTQLPPQGVLMTLVTNKGTYINLTGKIDKVTK
jgi:hypothetical protein